MSNPLLPIAEELYLAYRKGRELNHLDTVPRWSDMSETERRAWLTVAREACEMSDMMVPIRKALGIFQK